MGKRREGSHDKDGKNSRSLPAKSNLLNNNSKHSKHEKLKSSAVVKIDYKCWRLAEEALLKTISTLNNSTNTSTQVSSSKDTKVYVDNKTRGKNITEDQAVLLRNDVNSTTTKKVKKAQLTRASEKSRRLSRPRNCTRRVDLKQRKASLRKVTRALRSVRNRKESKKQNFIRRRSTRITKLSHGCKNTKTKTRPKNTTTKTRSSEVHRKQVKHLKSKMDARGKDDYAATSDEQNRSPFLPPAQNQNDVVRSEPPADDDSDDVEMQVLEKQVSSDKDDNDEDEVLPVGSTLHLSDDTDEESSLLSPSALPASSVFRSPSRRKLSKKKKSKSSNILLRPVFHKKTVRTDRSYSPCSTSSLTEKRGRGRPRKPLEDVKSVSGKLYRKKLAERTANASESPDAPRTSTSFSTLTSTMESAQHDADANFVDAVEDDGTPSNQRMNRWNNRSTFVYAKHKFVSNENKFKCDTCKVSFTALSSLKRHYGTIYHKQQEVAGSNLDLSDILRPDRSSIAQSTSSSGSRPVSASYPLLNGRGRGKPPGAQARTTSFVRRNAVDSIKKYYAAADAARRRREIGYSVPSSSSAFISWKSKYQRKSKPLHHPYFYSSADMESDIGDFDFNDEEFQEDNFEDDMENSIPAASGRRAKDTVPEPKKWLSNSWKGVGSYHFTCEVCGQTFYTKMEFTSHLYMHRLEEQQEERLTCSDCQTRFPNQILLKHHNMLDHCFVGNRLQSINYTFPCDKCSSVFSRREYLKKHVFIHRRPKLSCPHCSEQFDYKFYLHDHIKIVHEGCVDLANIISANLLKPKLDILFTNLPDCFIPPEKRNKIISNYKKAFLRRNPQVMSKKNKPLVDRVPKFITCKENNDQKNVEETLNLRCSADIGNEQASSFDTKPVNLMQKFFDSQEEIHSNNVTRELSEKLNGAESVEVGKVGESVGVEKVGESVGVGKVGESDGNIVIQFEPMKHSIFGKLYSENNDGDTSTCLSPLTIEIPRDVNNDNKEENLEHDSMGDAYEDKVDSISCKTRILNNTPLGPLLGCGVASVLLERPLQNGLTCQDCGKSFDHRKSLVKHVQYFGQKFSCTICNKSFRLKHHVSRHMKSFHNIDTNSTTSSTSGDNADQQGDVDEPCVVDTMNSPSGSSSEGLLSIPSELVDGDFELSGTSRSRKYTTTSGETSKRKLSSVKSALSIVRNKSWTCMRKADTGSDTDKVAKRPLSNLSPNSEVSDLVKRPKPKTSSVSSESSIESSSSAQLEASYSDESYCIILDSNGAPAYKCLICKKLYPSKHQLNSHLWYHKRASVYKCNVCSAEFKFKHDLNAHHQIHDVHRVRFKCEKCPKSFSWRKDLLKHLRMKHDIVSPLSGPSFEDKLSRCPFCTLVFPQDGDLSSHITEVHTKCVVCQECGQVLGSQELLNEHMEQEHDDESGQPPTPSPHNSPIHMYSYSQEHDGPSSPEYDELLEVN